MIRPFPPILHKKFRKYDSIPGILLYCLDEKCLAQNCFAPEKQDVFARTRQIDAGILFVFQGDLTQYCRKKTLFRLQIPMANRLIGEYYLSDKLRIIRIRKLVAVEKLIIIRDFGFQVIINIFGVEYIRQPQQT